MRWKYLRSAARLTASTEESDHIWAAASVNVRRLLQVRFEQRIRCKILDQKMHVGVHVESLRAACSSASDIPRNSYGTV